MVRYERFVNNATTTLNGAITDVATSMTVTDGTVYPSEGDYRVQIDQEIVLVTARSTHVLTIERGVDGTAGAAHSSGADTTAIITKGSLDRWTQDFIDPQFNERPTHRLLDATGTVLTKADFTELNFETSVATDRSDGGVMIAREDQDGSSQDLRLHYKAEPSTPYTVTAHFLTGYCESDTGQAEMGLGFRESATGKLSLFVFRSGKNSEVRYMTDPDTGFGSATGVLDTGSRFDWWMRIENDGVNLDYYRSADGVSWYLQRTEAVDYHFTTAPDGICWGGDEPNSGTPNTHMYLLSWIEA